jgi:16S rRNA (guanine527-N7)-methyltransferase
MTTLSFINRLNSGATELDLCLSESTTHRLLAYLELMAKWNTAYNLTAIRTKEAMLSHHLFDSLAILPFIRGSQVLDVGTGAGLPGIPLALVMPTTQFVLLDSNGKKTRFLSQVKHELGLENVQVVQTRVETYLPQVCFTTIVSRAFSSLVEMLQKTEHLCCNDGQFLAMKGIYPGAELAEMPTAFKLAAIQQLQVPELAAERHVVIIERNN